ncbi:hypothetical protein Ahia01_001161600 [Argonauta hians]
MTEITEVSSNKCCGGLQKVFKHSSSELKCEMKFGIFLPGKSGSAKLPVLYWLSGLTCTEQNFITKSGFQRYAEEHSLIVVAPDTSPRGCNIEGEDDSYDFGSGAGFYVDATQPKWSTNYRMYSYIVKELPKLIESNFPVLPDKKSISGHSMGGHGAMMIALRNPGVYKSVSAFAPICNPVNCDWGKKCFSGYLGDNQKDWEEYDSCCLIRSKGSSLPDMLVDQGAADDFLKKSQLLPEALEKACAEKKVPLTLRRQADYDHSYYFIASFIGDHLKFHAKYLN